MQSLENMRRRIESANDLHDVVRVMKALAAVSIRQFEKAVESLVSYSETVELGLQILLRRLPELHEAADDGPFPWAGIPSPNAVSLAEPSGRAAIIFGSDQGMCGSFNEQVAAFALDHLQRENSFSTTAVVAVGSRVLGRLEDAGFAVARQFPVPSSVAAITSVVQDLLVEIERLQVEQGIGGFELFHHRPAGRAVSQPHRQRLLPVESAWLAELAARPWPGPGSTSRSLPTFTMDWRSLFAALIRQYIFHILYRAFAESLASENASRLASMQMAEKNIQEHLTWLTSQYHQQRQQSITAELLDIVSGFETLTAKKPTRNT